MVRIRQSATKSHVFKILVILQFLHWTVQKIVNRYFAAWLVRHQDVQALLLKFSTGFVIFDLDNWHSEVSNVGSNNPGSEL